LSAVVALDALPDPPPPPHPARANSSEESNNDWNFISEAQSKNTGSATSCTRCAAVNSIWGLSSGRCCRSRSLELSLPADIAAVQSACAGRWARGTDARKASVLRVDLAASDGGDPVGPAGSVARIVRCRAAKEVSLNLDVQAAAVLNLPIWEAVCILRSESYRTDFLRSAEKT
jgi:hypothetical protein